MDEGRAVSMLVDLTKLFETITMTTLWRGAVRRAQGGRDSAPT